jgi:uncharacterized protein YecT (DUF1311 family)
VITKSLSLILIAATFLGNNPVVQAQTQLEMRKEACDRFAKADAELDRVYRKILVRSANDAALVAKLQAAQRAWLSFRDAHLESLYPNPDPMAYGSVNPMCRCAVLEELTAQRAKQLNDLWVKGTPEGNVCAGSMARADPPKPVRKKR